MKWSQIQWTSWTLLLAVIAGGSATTVFLYWNAERRSVELEQIRFESQASAYSISLHEEFSRYATLLRGMCGLFEASDRVTVAEWDRYLNAMKLDEQFFGIRCVALIQQVSQDAIPQFLEEMRTNGAERYKLWPEDKDSIHFPIVYIAPDRFKTWQGFEMGNHLKRLGVTTDRDDLQVTQAVVLNSLQPEKEAFSLWLRVHPQSGAAAQHPSGWIFALVDLERIVQQVGKIPQFSHTNLQIFDGKGVDPAHLSIARIVSPDEAPLFSVQMPFIFGGKEWTLLFTSGPGFRKSDVIESAQILVGMAFSTLLLLGIVYHTLEQKESALSEVRRLEEETGNAVAMREAILNSIEYGVIATDEKGQLLSFNRAAERILGYSAAEVIGKISLLQFYDPQELQRRASELSTLLGHRVMSGLDVFTAVAAKGIPDEGEWTYIRKDRGRVTVHVCLSSVQNGEAKKGIGFVATVRPK